MLMQIKLANDAVIPKYETIGAAGFDIQSIEEKMVGPKTTVAISTGLHFAVPINYELQIRPRSGLSLKTKLRVILGTVDSDYRGEVKVIIENVGDDYIRINKGDRIAQGIISPIIKAEFQEVSELDETKRGSNGFGSTGYNNQLSDLIKQIIK